MWLRAHMVIVENIIRIWGVGLIIGAMIPFMREQTWWLRAWTYARLQMLCLCTLTAIILYVSPAPWFDTLLDNAIIGALILAAISCVWDVVPFTQLSPKQTRDHKQGENHTPICLMVGNVLMENDATQAYLDQIKQVNPDVLFLVETNDFWKQALSELEGIYPYRHLLPLPDFNGMLFYSRHPIIDVKERYLVQDHIPSLTIDLDVGHAEPLRLYGIHPRPPRPQDDTSDLDKELSFVANEVGHLHIPVIVTGDLNDVGWSSTTKKFLRISALLDPRHGRGLYNSYNAKNPIVRWPLDHVFHSRHFSLIDMKRLAPCGSDHFPILIKLALHRPTAIGR